jgi:tetratricopeptide (TPR) repeat protein
MTRQGNLLRRFSPIVFCFTIFLCGNISGLEGAQNVRPIALTVMPFTALKGEHQGWLSKGMADLFIKNLSQVDSFLIVERDRMQVFADELRLSETGLIAKDEVLRMGRVTRVEQVLYGSYSLSGNTIEINIFLLDIDSQQVLHSFKSSGERKQLRRLVKELSLELLQNKGIRLSREESEKIKFEATDSIQATEHFYSGVDLYDKGKYPDAFGRFFAASKQDPKYLEARFWMARLLEAQGKSKEAILTYRKIFAAAPASVEGQDALMFSGLVAEQSLKDLDSAIQDYRILSLKKPVTPHNLEASFRLGGLLNIKASYEAAYTKLQTVVDFYKKNKARWWIRLKTQSRNSLFFQWRHALNLNRDALRQMINLYPDVMESLPKKQWPPLPDGVYVVDPQNPMIDVPSLSKVSAMFEDTRKKYQWSRWYYTFIVPRGYLASGVDMEITGRIYKKGTSGQQSSNDFLMRVHSFPLPRNLHSDWLGALFGQTLKTTTLRKGISFHGENRSIFALEVGGSGGEAKGWKVTIRLQKEEPKEVSNIPVVTKASGSGEGMHLSTVLFPYERFNGSGHKHDFYMPRKELTMAINKEGRVGMVTVSGALDDAESDLWFSQSHNGKKWGTSIRMPINSFSEEYYPRLIGAEDGTFQLFWISKRRGQGWELWTSRLSKGKKEWTHPQRVPLELFAGWKKYAPKNSSEEAIPKVLEYTVTQDSRGQWILAYYSYVARRMVILRSINLLNWKEVARIDTQGPVFGPSLVEDSKEIYRLALFSSSGQPRLYSSNDGRKWSREQFSLQCECRPSFNEVHGLQLIPKPNGELIMLISDNMYGLQFAQFTPEVNSPKLDLVSRALMQPYTAVLTREGRILVALKQAGSVDIYQYKNFVTSKNNVSFSVIYTEKDIDVEGNLWKRIFAHQRFRVPDVTSLAVGPGTYLVGD